MPAAETPGVLPKVHCPKEIVLFEYDASCVGLSRTCCPVASEVECVVSSGMESPQHFGPVRWYEFCGRNDFPDRLGLEHGSGQDGVARNDHAQVTDGELETALMPQQPSGERKDLY